MVTLQSNFTHQQKSQDGYRLLHYSLDRFFTPTLSLVVKRHNSDVRVRWLSLGKLFLLLLSISPLVLVLVLLVNLGTEIKHMRQSLDRLDVIQSPMYGKAPALSTETIFITTTIIAPSPTTAIETDNMNDHTTTISLTSTMLIVPTTSVDPTPSTPSLRTSDQSQTYAPTFTLISTPSSSPRLSENSLIPIPALPFEWSNLRIDLPPAARDTVDKVLEGLGFVWQVFRKAYHYPLDPP